MRCPFQKLGFLAMLAVCIGLLLSVSDVAGAKELAGRKGFLIGLGPTLGGETNTIKQIAGGARFRMGGGLSEKVLLYWDSSYFFTRKNRLDYDIVQEQVKAQYFIIGHL